MVAVLISAIIHVGIAGVLILDQFRSPPPQPRIELARGEQASIPTVKFITNAELERMLKPDSVELKSTPPSPTVVVAPLPVSATTQPVAIETVPSPSPADATLVADFPLHQRALELYAAPVSEAQVDIEKPSEPVVAQPIAQEVAQQQVGVNCPATVSELPTPEYPAQSRQLGEQGLVILSALVQPDGRAEQIEVVKAPNYPRLISAAMKAMSQAKFTPAMERGQAVAQRIEVPFRFELR